MNNQDFYNSFKEQLNIRYQSAESKYNKKYDDYHQGIMDEIDRIEVLFDKTWKECEVKDDEE